MHQNCAFVQKKGKFRPLLNPITAIKAGDGRQQRARMELKRMSFAFAVVNLLRYEESAVDDSQRRYDRNG